MGLQRNSPGQDERAHSDHFKRPLSPQFRISPSKGNLGQYRTALLEMLHDAQAGILNMERK